MTIYKTDLDITPWEVHLKQRWWLYRSGPWLSGTVTLALYWTSRADRSMVVIKVNIRGQSFQFKTKGQSWWAERWEREMVHTLVNMDNTGLVKAQIIHTGTKTEYLSYWARTSFLEYKTAGKKANM